MASSVLASSTRAEEYTLPNEVAFMLGTPEFSGLNEKIRIKHEHSNLFFQTVAVSKTGPVIEGSQYVWTYEIDTSVDLFYGHAANRIGNIQAKIRYYSRAGFQVSSMDFVPSP